MERSDIHIASSEADPPAEDLATEASPGEARRSRFQREDGCDPPPGADLEIEPGWELA
jgi:hypothetical protein